MRDEIAHRFEQQIKASRQIGPHRVAGHHTGRHAQTLTEHVNQQLSSLVPSGAGPVAAIHAPGASDLRRTQVLRLLDDWSSAGLGGARRNFDLTIPTGGTIFAPPYDLEWQEGRGLGFGAKADGKTLTIDPEPGTTSGAGIGVFVNVTTPSLVSITPQGTYQFSWFSFEDLPNGWSKGGLGATVYQDANPTPIFSEFATLWSVGNIAKFTGGNGDGTVASAVVAGPSGIFGPQLYAPINLFMQPGSNYLVWIWQWQLGNVPDGSSFLSIMSVSVPMISLSAAPPPVIR